MWVFARAAVDRFIRCRAAPILVVLLFPFYFHEKEKASVALSSARFAFPLFVLDLVSSPTFSL